MEFLIQISKNDASILDNQVEPTFANNKTI